ncbi:T9SS type A sorting domain-containing protein [Flavobacterium sp. CBA20B-1]|uniref:T9SS type A sorting domain-containing protein n=1 Tax=unclassified Flavobacterium TaxID=196869 RepID=UPI0022255BDB|nr:MULTISPECIES: T9SS type A sorting domain-containing protein [unclassified Flavobacterium]WCM41583.1 T9SS type A sorting domain-containing protein [Flavobacterium sp. CBA20B-1]
MKKFILTLLILVPFAIKAQVTLIPDPVFEQLLINLNIDSDGMVNGQILTTDAQNVTQLNLFQGAGSFRIQNMTGIEAFTNLELLEGSFHEFNTINTSTLTKLDTLILSSNSIQTINLSNNLNLKFLRIGNDDLEFLQHNHMWYIDLSDNTKLEYLNVINLYSLRKINLKNHNSNKLEIYLGWSYSPFVTPKKHTVCIEVDDPVAATNKTFPYNNWQVFSDSYVNHYFDANCALSVEKFVNQNFKIYPNPATDYVAVEQKTTEGVHLQAVQILDSSGKLVHSVKENFDHINVSNLNNGVYLFVIQTDKGNKTEKIVIK